ncbi:MAG: 5-amino-6-(D-ribitylamino)uracil--L-tyrosine 4-hydroxyphenyl transferase CofH, partial [Micromonosporaceae bacterium]|nr:5-amino-6-(D-ribitylamino)uracil--L-tyrosine 4-hydroxyphenyl transferase CofH [Micromonosporaceae bacterium]
MITEGSPTGGRGVLRRGIDGLDRREPKAIGDLLAARGKALDDLIEAAGALRDAGLAAAGRPGVVTYSRKVFIPLTQLCRNRCGYCAFTKAGVPPVPFLGQKEVLEIAEAGAAEGCTEALFTLGDHPEDRWVAARRWLSKRGYDSTHDYLMTCARLVLDRTGLLPHLNPGVMTFEELLRLRSVAPSMGMMLETTATRLWREPGGPHYRCPDKAPERRLRVLEDAGRASVIFTTGILIGIGETLVERAEALLAIERIARRHGHVQEVIIQGLTPHPATAMRSWRPAEAADLAATVAVARLLLGADAHIQSPPNLIGSDLELLLRAGIDDLGGISPITPDHVNPAHPWPAIEDLGARLDQCGLRLAGRLAVYPEYLSRADTWIDQRLISAVRALADPTTGLAAVPPAATVPPAAATHQSGRPQAGPAGKIPPERLDPEILRGLGRAADNPASLLEPAHEGEALALLAAEGEAVDALAAVADDLRREAVGDDVTYVVNCNINFSNVCTIGCQFCGYSRNERDADAYRLTTEEIGDRAERAMLAGATEVCVQGGIDPRLDATGYLEILHAIRKRAPCLHIHAFSPMEVLSGARKAGVPVPEWLSCLREAGLDSMPGTAAEIFDKRVRRILTTRKLSAAEWECVVEAAHTLGIRSTATMMYGHVDGPQHWFGHIRTIAELQDRTGGFTEFVPLPFVHHHTPIYRAGLSRPGASVREHRVIHAMARVLLYGRIENIQCSWVKIGDEGAATLLLGGANDLGGTLMEESISRSAGSGHGCRRTVEQLHAIAAAAGRGARQRTTVY